MPQLDFVNFFSQIIWLIFFFSFFYVVSFKSAVPFLSNILKVRAKRKAFFTSEREILVGECDETAVSYNRSIINSAAEAKKFVSSVDNSVSTWEKHYLVSASSAISSNILYVKSLQQVLLSSKGVKSYL